MYSWNQALNNCLNIRGDGNCKRYFVNEVFLKNVFLHDIPEVASLPPSQELMIKYHKNDLVYLHHRRAVPTIPVSRPVELVAVPGCDFGVPGSIPSRANNIFRFFLHSSGLSVSVLGKRGE